MSRDQATVTVWSTSDGINTTPGGAALHRDDSYYERHLAQRWAQHVGREAPKTAYRLNKLPAGYAGWEKTRTNTGGGRQHVDRYLYGHPSGKPFDSLPKAWVHFQHWIDNRGNSHGCPCVRCESQPVNRIMTLDLRTIPGTTPYSILDLPYNASPAQVETAYTVQALSLDIDSSNPTSYGYQQLQHISQAKEILGDPRPMGRPLLDRCIRYAQEGYMGDRPWDFLGVRNDASRAQIEAAYQRCLQLWSEYEDVAPLVLHCIRAAREAMIRAARA
ncbi:Putative cryptic loci regulator 2, Chaperone J-domain superfamily [Septoria linicola]|uniref:Cryptic loci regulator 2, Chaperone J-domain superfamily n=1 Tax=Septoria linicola TaxID=215465 RepID=A0A9Q9AQW1_9PEZI|nr:putative cryptic loci regulator 2, Chaperone J-domain superfamily [Septoria linicola]USW52854.1 Putative cryptic loci regulator 2, Chaperone J-domain superfamily [Septoria linicola]